MRRPLLLLALAALLAGCGGGGGEDLLTENQADTLLSAVDNVERAVSADQCDQAEDAASAGRNAARELPNRVDAELKNNLIDWFAHLERRVRRDCDADPDEEPTAEPTETPTAEPTETPTAEPTETPTAEPTETPTAEPSPPGNGQGEGQGGQGTGGSAAPEGDG